MLRRRRPIASHKAEREAHKVSYLRGHLCHYIGYGCSCRIKLLYVSWLVARSWSQQEKVGGTRNSHWKLNMYLQAMLDDKQVHSPKREKRNRISPSQPSHGSITINTVYLAAVHREPPSNMRPLLTPAAGCIAL